MKLNKASLFALIAVLELASEPGRQVATAEIASKFGISNHHLTKIMHQLAHNGVVKSSRGAHGGCRFSGDVHRTTLLEVIQLFEKLEFDFDMPLNGKDAGGPIVSELQNISYEINSLTSSVLNSITVATALKNTRHYSDLLRQDQQPTARCI